jgi:hypothetical protein
MWTDGWTDSHHEPTTCFSDMCEVPDRFHFVLYVIYLQGTDLTFVGLEGAVLENDVTVVVNCYGVVLPTQDV